MLEHNAPAHLDSEADLRRSRHSSPPAPVYVPDSADSQARIDDYLDHVIAPLVGSVDYWTRQEVRRDMRAHLTQLIAAHEELGSDPAEATVAALRQFGPPSVVARNWLAEAPCTTPNPLVREPMAAQVGRSFRTGARRRGLSLSLWVIIMVFMDRQLNGGPLTDLYMLLGLALPFLVGLATGRRHAEGRPILGVLLAQAATVPLWPFLMMFLAHAFQGMQPDYNIAALAGLLSFVALAPTGCVGAWIGAQTRLRHRNRRPISAR